MTQYYVGTKIIQAWKEERDGKAGYAVKYPDGYISWSPIGTFEETYLPIGQIAQWPDYLQRMIGEERQLADKLEKLKTYMGTDTFKETLEPSRSLMIDQYATMSTYWHILVKRIALAQKVNDPVTQIDPEPIGQINRQQ